MSAPAFAIPAAPSTGHTAAPKRGAAMADADFAAILDDTAPADDAPRPAAPVIAKNETEATPVPVADDTAEAAEDAAPVLDETIVAAPIPFSVPALPVAVAVEVSLEGNTPAVPIAEAPPAPSDEVAADSTATPTPVAEPNKTTASSPVAPTAPAAPVAEDGAPAPVTTPAPTPAPADLPDLAALQSDLTRAAASSPVAAAVAPPAGAPVVAPVAPPAPRPAKSATDTVASTETAPADDAPVVLAAAPLEAAAPPVEAPRTRDAIDRAQATRAENQGAGVAPDPEPSSASDGPDVGTPSAATSAQTAATRPSPAVDAPAAPVVVADDAAVTPPLAAPTQTTEARAANTVLSLALSTTSHASIETTAHIAAQIIRKLEGRSTRFEMALTPEGLGQVDVSLDIDANGKLAARMAFDNPLAATELRGRVDELRRQLQEAGFTVADDALSFAERDASAGQQGGSAFDRRPDPRNARAFGAGARLSADADLAVTGRWIPLALTPDRVDMKV